MGIEGLPPVPPPLPEDVIKKLQKDLKTKLGQIAFSAVSGTKAVVGEVSKGINKAGGALNYVLRVMKEHTEEEKK